MSMSGRLLRIVLILLGPALAAAACRLAPILNEGHLSPAHTALIYGGLFLPLAAGAAAALSARLPACLFFILAAGLVMAAQLRFLDNYFLLVIMTMGINIIFASSLNLVNGYMGEFSCGHGGFMCVGAYVGSLISMAFFTSSKLFGASLLPPHLAPLLFPLVLIGAGLVSALFGLLVALPSFRTRGDYLAIITIAANYIIISLVENIDFIGGPRGLSGMNKTVGAMREVAEMPWMLIWVLTAVFASIVFLYRLVGSTYGKSIPAVCQNEIAAEIMGVNTDRVKLTAFMVSSGLAGVAGALYAHVYSYVNAQAFSILKSTEALVMVYMGGMGSLSGVIMAAAAFTLLVEGLRFAIPFINSLHILPAGYEISPVWKWVLIPLCLILLMQFRPEGLLGNRELSHFFPRLNKWMKRTSSEEEPDAHSGNK
ncbi:MAG: branched-chain amino acid ABC transporter permease [Desulfarculales bacterium]|jgi:branched-chain amino acid transport system permease protein|nr:branched-chain amino acid ABC transporter permease [Desulfarculales bacterium]